MSLMDMTARELGEEIQKRKVSAVEAVDAALAQIEQKDHRLHAYITVDAEGARRRAQEVQRLLDAGDLQSPLAGVPFAVKDNLCTRGMRTTCGSRILRDFVPGYDAFAKERLEQEGAILLGKTNLDEFAMGSTTETSYFGPGVNPWDEERVPGGSSGGSCAAVAAGLCSAALGSDTGGSIRQPAAHCGVTGLKPTYGTVSRYGLVAYASSMDQIGPIGKDVTDCALLLNALAAHDGRDSTSRKREQVDFLTCLSGDVKGLRIGIPEEYLEQGLCAERREAVLLAGEKLSEAGAQVEFFSLKLCKYAVPAYYVLASAEASSNLARFDGVKYGYRTEAFSDLHEMYKKTRAEGFGTEVKRRIMLGTFVLSAGYYDAYYRRAARVRQKIQQEFAHIFNRFDLILGPVTPKEAPILNSSLQNPLEMYLGDVYTVAANLTGIPAISIPWGLDRKGLPMGIQLMGSWFGEEALLLAARTCEQLRGDWTQGRKPAVCTEKGEV